jgi:hypothetical protein
VLGAEKMIGTYSSFTRLLYIKDKLRKLLCYNLPNSIAGEVGAYKKDCGMYQISLCIKKE